MAPRPADRRGGDAAPAIAFDCLSMVGKNEASPYTEGRTLAWLKVNVPHYREGERGWEPKP